jgi:hypothetical protein
MVNCSAISRQEPINPERPVSPIGASRVFLFTFGPVYHVRAAAQAWPREFLNKDLSFLPNLPITHRNNATTGQP